MQGVDIRLPHEVRHLQTGYMTPFRLILSSLTGPRELLHVSVSRLLHLSVRILRSREPRLKVNNLGLGLDLHLCEEVKVCWLKVG